MNLPPWTQRALAACVFAAGAIGNLWEAALDNGGLTGPEVLGAVVEILGALMLAVGTGRQGETKGGDEP